MLYKTSLVEDRPLFGRSRMFPTGNYIGISVIMMLVAMQVLLAWGGPGLASASATTDASLDRTWMRTDQPVAQQLTARTWIWGPQQNHNGQEMYKESPNGMRQVRYYDKSRMEINNPTADVNSKWFVTNGLLVKELISGMIQVGDNSFIPLGASNESVAGDPASVNPQAPTYLSFKPFASLNNDNRAENRVGQSVKERLYKAGAYDVDSGYNIYNVTYGYYEPILGHNVPNVFMQFFSRQGPVYENGKNTTGTVFDWIYAAGLPLTEPYWAKVKVGGVEKDVLVQAFERRVLTYTPANEDSWRVELGNVGSHYWGWRYTSDGKDKADPANNGGITPVPGGSGGGNTGGGNGSPTPGNGGGGNGGGGNGTPTPGNGGGGNGTPTPGNGGGGTVTPTPGGGGDGTPTPGGGGGGTVTPTPGGPTNGPVIDGDISISVGGPVDLNVGGTASVGVNVGSLNGLTGPVGLSIEGSLPGVSASLTASTVNLAPNGTAGVTLKLSANPGISASTGGLTIKASGGGKTATAGVTIKLKVPGSFNLSGGVGVALKVGNVAHASVTLGATGGFSGQCSLSAKATGIGLSASVTPTVNLGVNGSASADVTISSSTLVGAGVVVVTASCNGITRTTSINVAVSVL